MDTVLEIISTLFSFWEKRHFLFNKLRRVKILVSEKGSIDNKKACKNHVLYGSCEKESFAETDGSRETAFA